MDIQTANAGLIEVRAPGEVTETEAALVVDLTPGNPDVMVELNGRRFRADSPTALAKQLRVHGRADGDDLISIPYDVEVAGPRLIIGSEPDARSMSGDYLIGADAQAAVDKAVRIIASPDAAWPRALTHLTIDGSDMDAWSAGIRWDGPLVVSMPRTGSTLMGVLFLFCRDRTSPAGHRFDRYIHEPVAPVFWRGDGLDSVARFIDPSLSRRDVIQESAYQFADPRIARWFLTRAKPPVIFTLRHPQIAWPSRWRAMLSQLLDADPTHPDAAAAELAVAQDDFTELGEFLTRSVLPADNGFYAFLSLMDMCRRHGIEFVIVDNTRFRQFPEATLRGLCSRLGIEFDHAMTEWTDLEAVMPRVVMSDLALGDEYKWYYQQTLGSHSGIEPETRPLVPAESFPEQLRGVSNEHLTIDEAVTWYQLLLMRPETLS